MVQNIFNLQLRHSFYTNGLFPSAQLQLSAATQKILNDNGVLLRQQGSDWQFFAPPSDKPFPNLAEEDSLEFDIKVTNHEIINATDLPLDQLAYLLFSREDGANSLSASPVVTEEVDAGLLAKVVIRISDFLAAFQGEAIDYVLQFPARPIVIHYLLIPQTAGAGQLSLTGADAHYFSGPEAVQLPNGSTAQQYSSGENTFALKDQMQLKIGISGTLPGVSDPKELIAQLPMPNAIGLQVEEGRIVSKVYVYL